MDKVTTLTYYERLSLINQFQIKRLLEEENDYAYQYEIDILESGYSGLYDEVFTHIIEEQSEELTKETSAILNMFRKINNSIGGLSVEQKGELDTNALEFEGFDGHEKHFHVYTMWLKKGKWKENAGKPDDSHSSSTITKYREMINQFNMFDQVGNFLSFDQLVILSRIVV